MSKPAKASRIWSCLCREIVEGNVPSDPGGSLVACHVWMQFDRRQGCFYLITYSKKYWSWIEAHNALKEKYGCSGAGK